MGSSSDPCSAYGNRNFHLYFSAWFGSPTTGTVPWSIESANVFDEGKYAAIRLDNMRKKVCTSSLKRRIFRYDWVNTAQMPYI